MIKKSLMLLVAFILVAIIAQAAPRTYYNSGTATTTNATVTFTFNPASFCVFNDEASGGTALWFDATDGVAVAAANSTNIKVLAGESFCASLLDPNVSNVFKIGVITASSTAAYRVVGMR